MSGRLLLVAVILGTGCTRHNPEVCCVTADQCAAIGVDDIRTCIDGFACLENACVESTCTRDVDCPSALPVCNGGVCVACDENRGCTATAPVCDLDANTCTGCGSAADCVAYGSADLCDSTSRACVECLSMADCPVERPTCDAGVCRACDLDVECSSGACGTDGKCVLATAALYVDPAGTDAGSCTQAAPCKTISFTVGRATVPRNHVVVRPGMYAETVSISKTTTTAVELFIHGGGAQLRPPGGSDAGTILINDVATTIRNLIFNGNGTLGPAIQAGSATCTIERVKTQNNAGPIIAGTNTIVRDSELADPIFAGIYLTGNAHVVVDRVTVHGGYHAISSPSTGSLSTIDVTNMLVFGTLDRALNLTTVQGNVRFSTIADAGMDSGPPGRAVLCTPGINVIFHASIIWVPGSISRTPVDGGCTLNATIAGPTPNAGAMNVDPQFVDAVHRDYHLRAGSPARDLIDTGPAQDYERDARPMGTSFDIGADEAP